ncbi:MAG: two component transcriptional regulator [Candidatus Doudnabacteria bacterium]|nr:two component transcriptional regulator [Candidatus Doudnabacteria bacterium]
MKILLIEDNQKLAESIKRGLEPDGYSVDIVGDGLVGQQRLEAHKDLYDLVILDLMLPGKTGTQVCVAWRDQNIVVPILMLTARDTVEDKVLGLDSGADDYLVKPFDFAELIARIRALLRRPTVLVDENIVVGPLSLRTSQKQIFLNDKALELTLREYAVLEYCMRHPKQVLGRDQILSSAWDYSFDSFSNVVDVHIKNLRKKLGTYGKTLQTVRGLGYRLAL